jgi:hypothetical protein
VNGTAATFMTSDSAPAQNLGVAYTWTALHTFNGGLAATTVNATSDPRLKKRIRRVKDVGTLLDKLSGYRFNWRLGGKASMGVLSTEVKAVAPELVSKVGKHEAVNYNGLVAMLIEEVKSLRARVKELERDHRN